MAQNNGLSAYTIEVLLQFALRTLLCNNFLQHGEEFAGRIGLTLIVAGMLGTALFGIIMDRTLKYM